MSKPWKEYSFAEMIDYFQKNVEDCFFLVGMKGEEDPRELKSFRFVLSSISPVFDRMFNSGFKEAKSTNSAPIIITEIYACDFAEFLSYVHGSKPYLARWKKLYEIAKKYLADGVVESIISDLQFMKKTPAEALQLFEILNMEAKDGNERKFNYDKKLLCQAVQSSCPYILSLSTESFQELLSITADTVHVTTLFQTIANYCTENHPNPNIVELLLRGLDLTGMSFGDYLKYVECLEVFDVCTKHRILVDICRQRANNNE